MTTRNKSAAGVQHPDPRAQRSPSRRRPFRVALNQVGPHERASGFQELMGDLLDDLDHARVLLATAENPTPSNYAEPETLRRGADALIEGVMDALSVLKNKPVEFYESREP